MSNFSMPVLQDATVTLKTGAKVKSFRAEQAKFFVQMNDWMQKTNVGVITSMAQSESNGWITLTVCYFEAPEEKPVG